MSKRYEAIIAIGHVFGRLTVTRIQNPGKKGSVRVSVKCLCGSSRDDVALISLVGGHLKSCSRACARNEIQPDVQPGFKRCSRCKDVKSRDEFKKRPGSSDGVRGSCKKCQNMTAYRSSATLAAHLRNKYGLTIDGVNAMFAKQGFACKICGRELLPLSFGSGFADRSKKLQIDHDHKTSFVRGILCQRCNTGLAFLSSAGVLKSAAAYLEEAEIAMAVVNK